MTTNMTASECAAWLAAHNNYLIISHRHPDGDTLCSGAALCSALRRSGKRAWCIYNKDITDTYRPLVSEYYPGREDEPTLPISVDVADSGLFPRGFDGLVRLAIDHHASHRRFSEELCLDPELSSCGELVMQIINALCGDITPHEASLLYAAVSTDTGCFQYSNTNSATLRAAADLIDLGADSQELNIQLFRTMTPARMELEGRMLTSMERMRDGKVCAVCVTREMMRECGATEDDCEDLAGITGKSKGCLISVTVRETGLDRSKVSVRTRPGYSAAAICAVYGGGGHEMAAGVTLSLAARQALYKILNAIYKLYPDL